MSIVFATKSYCYRAINYATKILFVGNLNNHITNEALRTYFGFFGDIINIETSVMGTFGFVEYVHKMCVSNVISQINGHVLEGNYLHLDYGSVIAPRCLLLHGIPESVDEDCLVYKINYHLSNLKLDTIKDCLMDETNGSALLFFKYDLNKVFDILREFYIEGVKLDIDFASNSCMFAFGDTPDISIYKANTEVTFNNSICHVPEQSSTTSVDYPLSNSTIDPNICKTEPTEHENDNLVNNNMVDNSHIRNIRSPKAQLNSEMALPTHAIYPRIRVIPLAKLMDGTNDTTYTSHASTGSSPLLIDIKDDKPLDLSANNSIDQSAFNNSIASLESQESDIEETQKQSDTYFETQCLSENITQPIPSSSADNIDEDQTNYFVNETKIVETIEEYKVVICKKINNSKRVKKANKIQKKIIRKEKKNPVIKIEEDEPFIKYESMYDKVKTRTNRNSLNLKKVKVKEEPNCYYSLRPRK